MKQPGLNTEPFYIYFRYPYFSRRIFLIGTTIHNIKVHVRNIIRWIGCYVKYELMTLSDPVEENGNFKYEVELKKYKLYIFWINVYTYKYKEL